MAVVAVVILVALAALQLTGEGARRENAPILTVADVQRITPQAAKELLAEGRANLFDVRSAQEYAQAHAEGAYLFPMEEAEQLTALLPMEGALIFY
jgi:hypothetical protein